MKKTIFVFLAALALLMLVAIPATAGPSSAPLALIESAVPAILTTPAKASIAPAEGLLYFSKNPPFFARILASPLVAIALSIAKPTMYIALLATLAGLIWGIGLSSMTVSRRLKYDPRDRMHGLARDQDAMA